MNKLTNQITVYSTKKPENESTNNKNVNQNNKHKTIKQPTKCKNRSNTSSDQQAQTKTANPPRPSPMPHRWVAWDVCCIVLSPSICCEQSIKASSYHVLKLPYNLLKLVWYLFPRKRVDKCIASANARQSVLLCWQFQIEIAMSEKQIALFSVHGSQCFVFAVHSVWCSRDFLCSNLSVWTCKSKAM